MIMKTINNVDVNEELLPNYILLADYKKIIILNLFVKCLKVIKLLT